MMAYIRFQLQISLRSQLPDLKRNRLLMYYFCHELITIISFKGKLLLMPILAAFARQNMHVRVVAIFFITIRTHSKLVEIDLKKKCSP